MLALLSWPGPNYQLKLAILSAMRIKKLTLDNVKSFRQAQNVEFNQDLNIFIGPNAGGKSNLLEILRTLLARLYPSWYFAGDGTTSTIEHQSVNLDQNLEKHLDATQEHQTIKITFEITPADIQRMELIRNNQHRLFEFEEQRYGSKNLLNTLNSGESHDLGQYANQTYEYVFINRQDQYFDESSSDRQFIADYLQSYDLASLLISDYNQQLQVEKIEPIGPLFQFFSPYRSPDIHSLQVHLSSGEISQVARQYKQGGSQLLEYAKYHYALKLRTLGDEPEKFQKEPETKLLLKHLEKLGYTDLEVKLINATKNIYDIVLKKGDRELSISLASSGEKEILNMLLSVLAFNIRDGLIAIDEPELHLHPRWQKLFLEVLTDLSMSRNVQFFIVTHSPQFVTTASIGQTIRVFQAENSSQIVAPDSSILERSEAKDLFQVINVLNNEKLFFADKVVLVEGVIDRLIYEKIVRILQKELGSNEIIEVLDVGGKHNLSKFQGLLPTFGINSFICADQDFVIQIANEEIKSLLQTDHRKVKASLKDKSSRDGKRLAELFGYLLSNEQKHEKYDHLIVEILAKNAERHQILSQGLSQADKNKFLRFIDEKALEKIFVLGRGELEVYFGVGKFDIESAIETRQHLNRTDDIPEELGDIMTNIIND